MNVFSSFIKLNFTNKFYVIFISCFWLVGYFLAFWRRLGLEDSGIIIANIIFMMILALLCVKKWFKRIRIFDFVFYIFLVTIYFANSIYYPRTTELVSTYAVEVVIGTLPFYFVGLIFKYEGNERWIAISARLAVVLNILYSFIMSSDSGDAIERMHRAYILLPSVLYILWLLMNRFNLIDLVFFAIGFFLECSLGSRGPFVCIVFFGASYYFFFKDYKHKKLMRVLTIFLALILYMGSTYFALFMVGLLSMTGRSTRIFDLMLNDALVNYEESNGRDMMQSFLIQKLDSNAGGHGFGLLADRLEVGYAHNIFVELWYAYGYTIGSIVICLFLLLFIFLLLKTKSNSTKVIALLFFTASFLKLQFSGTFIMDSLFFFLIGYCVNGIRETGKLKRPRY